MKGTLTRILQWGKSNYQKVIIVMIAIVWVTSTFFACKAIRQPLRKENKITQNILEQKKAYHYAAKVKPSVLYPEGGVIVPEGVIFNSLTEQLIITLDAGIHSEKSIKVEGSAGIVYSIVAKDLWEREYELIANQTIMSEGVNHSLLQEEFSIDVKKIVDLIETIEEETLARPVNYLLVIRQKISGKIYQENGEEIRTFNSDLEIPFELTSQYIKYAGESSEKEFVDIIPIEEVNIIDQSFHFLNHNVSIIGARYSFSLISILTFIPLFIKITKKYKHIKNEVTEIDMIDKKHKGRIIEVADEISFEILPKLGLKNFNTLLQIADEKEEPIFKFADTKTGSVFYYILGTSNIYYYSIAEKLLLKGSELALDM
ncbi:MAG: hypothetical protein K0R15_750 [Clostridiales bacterium]|jgi:hypothetical protein|nr:hypothetical protein [Clostridiales bacterium]